ncbi:phage integrase family protein [Chlamydia ibidis]|uniref:Phage integrase family protein n=1 Tax=Chlamydia ibidis TaxID=1405396 RepID=S7J5U2_9CHLA|nr:site-specific integrase [Chlamydia ibidis]EPP35487.1 phage integrase family protein [Chlamydia ibidis]
MNSLSQFSKNRLSLTVSEAANLWLTTLSPITRKNYASGIRFLYSHALLRPFMKLEDIMHLDHCDVLHKIKNLTHSQSGKLLSEASKQARAACYISFTKFLYRLTRGSIKQACPSRRFGEATFYKIRDKVKTEFILKKDWLVFLDTLKQISYRDYLIGKLIIQGVRKLKEVISLRSEDISFSMNQILFKIHKRQRRIQEVKVTYANSLMSELKDYLGDREGFVFISASGQQVSQTQVCYNFKAAEHEINSPIKVTPHVLRASALAYLKTMGFPDEDIMRVSCFSSTQMLSAYDTRPHENLSAQLPIML